MQPQFNPHEDIALSTPKGFSPHDDEYDQQPQEQKEAASSLEKSSEETNENETDQSKKRKKLKKNRQSACACFTVSYWSIYFEFNEREIFLRTVKSLIPGRLSPMVQDAPDLYGPFWLSVMLVFLLSIAKEFMSDFYILLSSSKRTTYNFNSIGYAAAIVFLFQLICPLLFLFVNKVLGQKVQIIVGYCIFGYSYIYYILVTFVSCFLETNYVRVPLFVLAFVFSCVNLIMNFRSYLKEYTGKTKICTYATIVLTNLLFLLAVLHFIFTVFG